MQIAISARHGHLSEVTQEKIREKVSKVTRFFDRLTGIEVIVDLSKPEEPNMELKVTAEHSHEFVAAHQSADMFGSLDQAIHKVEHQIKKHKERLHS
ncbi:MAG: ribosome hibernation-promoting factor, HPF/YfiA family [Thermoguttaceae bacterium]